MAKPKRLGGTAYLEFEHPEIGIHYEIEAKWNYSHLNQTYDHPAEEEFDILYSYVTHICGVKVKHKEDEVIPNWITQEMIEDQIYQNYIENN